MEVNLFPLEGLVDLELNRDVMDAQIEHHLVRALEHTLMTLAITHDRVRAQRNHA